MGSPVSFIILSSLQVFDVNASLPHNGDLNYKPASPVFSEPSFSTASTQTPPEFAPSEDELQPGMQIFQAL